MTRIKTPKTPASACPVCFRNGHVEPQEPGIHNLRFNCRCGAKWRTPHKMAWAHGDYLRRLGRPMPPPGDS